MQNSNNPNSHDTDQQPDNKKPRRKWIKFSVAGIIGAMIGGATLGALSHAHFSEGGWGPGRFCHHSYGARHHHGPIDTETLGKRTDSAIDWLSKQIEASDAQRTQIKEIMHQAIKEASPLIDEHRSNRDALVNELIKTEVDRNALEKLRKNELALAERASSHVIDTIADAAAVLTPEQRARVAELRQSFHR